MSSWPSELVLWARVAYERALVDTAARKFMILTSEESKRELDQQLSTYANALHELLGDAWPTGAHDPKLTDTIIAAGVGLELNDVTGKAI